MLIYMYLCILLCYLWNNVHGICITHVYEGKVKVILRSSCFKEKVTIVPKFLSYVFL